MRTLESITGHVIYNPVYTYKFQLKTTKVINHQLMLQKIGPVIYAISKPQQKRTLDYISKECMEKLWCFQFSSQKKGHILVIYVILKAKK